MNELHAMTNRELASRIISLKEPYLTDSTLFIWERDNLAKSSKASLIQALLESQVAMKTIQAVLMERDGLKSEQADNLVDAAKVAFQQYLDEEDHNAIENICIEFFDIHDLEYVFELLD